MSDKLTAEEVADKLKLCDKDWNSSWTAQHFAEFAIDWIPLLIHDLELERAEVERLRDVLVTIDSHCPRCRGCGVISGIANRWEASTHYPEETDMFREQPCWACAFVRAALEEPS